MKMLTKIFALLIVTSAMFAFAKPYSYKINSNSSFKKYKQQRIEFSLTVDEEFDSDKNMSNWEEIVKNSDEILFLAYLGSSKTMVGRDASMPWNKIKYVEAGISDMEAVLDSIDQVSKSQIGFDSYKDMEIKSLIGISYLSLPNVIFKTAQEGENLLQQVLSDSRFTEASEGFKSQTMVTLAKHYVDSGTNQSEAKRMLIQILSMSEISKKVRDTAMQLQKDIN